MKRFDVCWQGAWKCTNEDNFIFFYRDVNKPVERVKLDSHFSFHYANGYEVDAQVEAQVYTQVDTQVTANAGSGDGGDDGSANGKNTNNNNNNSDNNEEIVLDVIRVEKMELGSTTSGKPIWLDFDYAKNVPVSKLTR